MIGDCTIREYQFNHIDLIIKNLHVYNYVCIHISTIVHVYI